MTASQTTPSPLARRKLPSGIQTFRKIREANDYYYVDKTGFAVDLIEHGSYYFLSRPRRFGKSLLLDTFKDLFEGHQSLFTGLAAETRWDWTKKVPGDPGELFRWGAAKPGGAGSAHLGNPH